MFLECTNDNTLSINFKVYGHGPAIVLFHPSPNSSRMMHPLASILSKCFTVICPDTPGYGKSDKLTTKQPSMKDFVAAFKKLFDDLGLKSFAIYGSATGAQLAIRYGLEYPKDVSFLFLDNTAHFTDEERTAILSNYFPDLTPTLDGQHLVKLWDIVDSLFKYFPWCFKDEAHKLNGPVPPPEVLHGIVMDYLQAGGDYDIAYKAAFNHEKVDYIQALQVPTTIFRWHGSILKSYTDRLFDYTLPDNCKGLEISKDRSARSEEMAAHIKEVFTSSAIYNKDQIAQRCDATPDSKESKVMLGKPPIPTPEGIYLIKAWHQLRDREFLSDKEQSKEIDIEALQLQSQLYDWYSQNN